MANNLALDTLRAHRQEIGEEQQMASALVAQCQEDIAQRRASLKTTTEHGECAGTPPTFPTNTRDCARPKHGLSSRSRIARFSKNRGGTSLRTLSACSRALKRKSDRFSRRRPLCNAQ